MAFEFSNMGPQSNEEIVRRLRDKMYEDQARLSNNPYPAYQGQMISPMSASTQIGRNLKSQWGNKPAPYSNKINQVQNRASTGFTEPQIQQLMDMMRRDGLSERMGVDRLNKQFSRNFGYEQPRDMQFRGKVGSDVNRSVANSEHNIRDLSTQLGLLEGKRNNQISQNLTEAGLLKKGRREAHVNQLEEFGNQEHTLRNLKNKSNQDTFYEELNAPYRKIGNTETAIGKIDLNDMHPERVQMNNQQLQKLANSYNQPYAPYPGERVIDVHPQTSEAWNLTNQINPKYRDTSYNDRKAIEQDWLQGDNIATKTFQKLPEGVDPLMNTLDILLQQQLKKESKNIAGKYVRLGTYGSAAHKGETEKALRNILKLAQQEREGVVLGTAKSQAGTIGGQEENNTNRYGQMTRSGTNEFMNMLESNKNLAALGNRKWANEQEGENERMQAWYNQINYENPTLHGLAPTGSGTGSQNPSPTNTNLNTLFSQTAPYSETVKDPLPQNQSIVNQNTNMQYKANNTSDQKVNSWFGKLLAGKKNVQALQQQRLQQQQLEQQRLEQQRLQQQQQQGEALRRENLVRDIYRPGPIHQTVRDQLYNQIVNEGWANDIRTNPIYKKYTDEFFRALRF